MNKKLSIILFVAAFLISGLIIIALLIKLSDARQKLDEAANILESMGNSKFDIDAEIHDTIAINTSFHVQVSIPVHVSMWIDVNAPVQMNVPVQKELMIPVHLIIDEMLSVDTLFHFPDGFTAPVNDSIPLDDKIKIRFLGLFRVPFRSTGQIRLNQDMFFNPEAVRVASEIPVQMQIYDSIPVFLNFTMPVNDSLHFPLKVSSQAMISFYEDFPVEGDIPIHMNSPVPLDFSKTPLKAKFDSLADIMRNLL
ncbi:MAG: hypothetical protein C0592_03100 [Marinilabiliales bacterium]|nr:MAG: hypothetical protein C0592_03100 [Marinilabiliales bacterium]